MDLLLISFSFAFFRFSTTHQLSLPDHRWCFVIHFCNGTAGHCSVFSVQCSVFSVYAHFSKQTNIVRKAFSENGQLKTYSKGTECSRAVAEKTRRNLLPLILLFGVKCRAGITSTYEEKLRCLEEHQSLVPFSSPVSFRHMFC